MISLFANVSVLVPWKSTWRTCIPAGGHMICRGYLVKWGHFLPYRCQVAPHNFPVKGKSWNIFHIQQNLLLPLHLKDVCHIPEKVLLINLGLGMKAALEQSCSSAASSTTPAHHKLLRPGSAYYCSPTRQQLTDTSSSCSFHWVVFTGLQECSAKTSLRNVDFTVQNENTWIYIMNPFCCNLTASCEAVLFHISNEHSLRQRNGEQEGPILKSAGATNTHDLGFLCSALWGHTQPKERTSNRCEPKQRCDVRYSHLSNMEGSL